MTTLVATAPIIRARLRKATAKNHRRGVLGLRAQPHWDGADFEHEGVRVTVVACPSVLAIWEAIDSRKAEEWTVVLTNVDDDELGDTVLAHLLDGRLITRIRGMRCVATSLRRPSSPHCTAGRMTGQSPTDCWPYCRRTPRHQAGY